MFNLLSIFTYSVLFIASIQSVNSVSPMNDHRNKTSNGTQNDLLDKIKLSLVSEGGNLLPLQKENVTSLISLDDELLGKTKEKAVVPRKGVDNLLTDNTEELLKNSSQQNNANSTISTPLMRNSTAKSSLITSEVSKETDLVDLSTKASVGSKQTNSTGVHKKPMILSYEAVANLEKSIRNNESKIPVALSTKTSASSQIPSPNEDAKLKVLYPTNTNSHPGMIMPIVITILVVPMFAIVGYMALRRGQEAWKNRHYKRMDFLLDGMYND